MNSKQLPIWQPAIKLLFCLLASIHFVHAQPGTDWDDNRSKDWPSGTFVAHVKSTADSTLQPIYCYAVKNTKQRPLIVSLHTWSGDYRQKDPIVDLCIQKKFNYIHPDFRGANTRPEACGSELVIQDIDDAIDWAIRNMDVDTNDIHVIGVSGGAHATLITYMNSKHTIKSFHAFAGIYNLTDWYYESMGRGNSYAKHISAVTSGKNGVPDFDEARNRSPFFMQTPVNLRSSSTLNLYTGVHDGYTGSVPISQTLEMYNKIVKDFDPQEINALIPIEHRYTLLKRRRLKIDLNEQEKFLNREVLYNKSFKNVVNVLIFDGGHEMPAGDSLQSIE